MMVKDARVSTSRREAFDCIAIHYESPEVQPLPQPFIRQPVRRFDLFKLTRRRIPTFATPTQVHDQRHKVTWWGLRKSRQHVTQVEPNDGPLDDADNDQTRRSYTRYIIQTFN